MSSGTQDGRDTELGDLSPAVITRAIEIEPRLGEDLRIELHGLVTEVQRGEALVVVAPIAALARASLDPYLPRLAQGHCGVVLVGHVPEGTLDRLPKSAIVAIVPDLVSADGVFLALSSALERVELRVAAERRGRWLNRYRYELGELIEISRAISQERDLDRLLDLILVKSRFITGADAGSIYVIETTPPAVEGGTPEKRMRFKLSQNESISFASSEFTIPMSTRSIAGAAAVTRKAINIPDVYELIVPPDAGDEPIDTLRDSVLPDGASRVSFDPSFDQKVGYRTKSMIAVPMISAQDDVIGVIQLINKKTDPRSTITPETVDANVVPFDQRSEDLLATLASQAGIALENALLYDEIRKIFEGFVRASVQAIEQRDPTTSGHSLRVSLLSVGLAEAVDRIPDGPYANVRFNKRDLLELEYASLLHDFGKIGVREEVLVKAKKLYPHQLDAVKRRFEFAELMAERDALGRKLRALSEGAGPEALARIESELEARRAQLRAQLETIAAANEPTVLKEGDFTKIAEIGTERYRDLCGHEHPLLEADEVVSLQVTRGSLHEKEIEEIRSHVVHTKEFLSSIPWGKNFVNVPLLAGAHHERLNGKGYPEGRTATQIPVGSKIMTIADIFDALTARDRPYKKAMPIARALDILGFEVKDGHIDPDLVRTFTEAEVWKRVEGIS